MKYPNQNKSLEIQTINEKITKLLNILNAPETKCTFWKVNEPEVHIMGLRPVNRTTIEVINENGFNPYDKKMEEKLFKCFKIFITIDKDKNKIKENKNEPSLHDIEINKKNKIEENGIIYIRNNDLFYIFDKIRKSS